jgi:hypothetical protein
VNLAATAAQAAPVIEHGAVAVKSATGFWTAAGVWTGVIVAIVGAVTAYIKYGPRWKELGIGERGRDFEAMDKRISSLETKVFEADKRATEANERAHNAEKQSIASAASFDIRLMSALNACRLLLGVVEREAPESVELSLAKDLLAMAASDDMGVGKGMRKIATMRGVGQ